MLLCSTDPAIESLVYCVHSVSGTEVLCYARCCCLPMTKALLAKAEARLAGVRAKPGWGARLVSGLAGSFVGRIVRNLSVSVSTAFDMCTIQEMSLYLPHAVRRYNRLHNRCHCLPCLAASEQFSAGLGCEVVALVDDFVLLVLGYIGGDRRWNWRMGNSRVIS